LVNTNETSDSYLTTKKDPLCSPVVTTEVFRKTKARIKPN